jgi:exonuclease SbcC
MSIVTQRKNAAGEPVETFDILVHDADTNEAKSLAVMSGGQKVWINEALTRAIALYMARGNERRYQALFCDESDGPLDAERKRMFVQMQRKVLELGGYERAFFITQTPELLGYADAVIDLS